MKEGVPIALIACVGQFSAGAFWVEGGGVLNPSIQDQKCHILLHNGSCSQGARPLHLGQEVPHPCAQGVPCIRLCMPGYNPSPCPLQHTSIAWRLTMAGVQVGCSFLHF